MILTCLQNRIYVLTLVLMFIFPVLAFAQSSVSLSVSPTVFQMTANPAQEWESTLRVINVNPFELKVYAEAVNFKPLGEGGASQFLPRESSVDGTSTFAEWITVPSGVIVVPAEEAVQIPVKINLPDKVPPGGHYAAILIGTRPPATSNKATRVETSQTVSSLMFLRVSGDVIESGNIRSFRTTDVILNKPEATFDLRFENKGNVHLRPQGEIRIFNMWGQERGFIPINQKTLFGNVLSDSVRSFNFTWTGEWSPADIGRYTAEATLAYGEDSRKFTSSETAFWVIPWKIILGFMVAIALIIFLVTWLLKLYIRKMLSVAGLERIHAKTNQANQRSKPRSVVAPIEVGILDLRDQLVNRKSNADTFKILLTFVKLNRAFFLGVFILAVITYFVIWFALNASQSDRSFEVVIDNMDSDITLSSEQIKYDLFEQTVATTSVKRNVPPIEIVNRSGVSGAAAELARDLEELGYTILKLRTDLSEVSERTIIVADLAYEEDSLELSTILDNALLSPFDSGVPDEPVITVFLGTDIVER